MVQDQNNVWFQKMKQIIPGGVNSPVRAFQSVGENPIIIESADGAYLKDLNGKHWLDYIQSWGAMILGHQHPFVMNECMDEIKKGIHFGLSSKNEYELAKLIVESYAGMDMIRFVTSGTEATMSALRVAKAYTNRSKIIKFAGCYHGHSDALLSKAGSGVLTYAKPSSNGVTKKMVEDTLIANYNDEESVLKLIKAHQNEIAAIIIEPVAANMGVIPAKKEFLQFLRNICNQEHIVLIFDEVITGFRLSYGSANAYFKVEPDMACFGKIIGGGLSVGAYGGKRDIMKLISPSGDVYQAGTLAGNPLAMHLGIKQLSYLKDHPEVYEYIRQYANELKSFLQQITIKIPFQVVQCESLLTLFFTDTAVCNYEDAMSCDTKLFQKFHQNLMNQGILIAPSQFEAMFISYAHSSENLANTKKAFQVALSNL